MVRQRIADVIDRVSVGTLVSNPLSVGFVLVSLVVIVAASSFPDDSLFGPSLFPIVTSIGIIVFAVADMLNGAESELEISDIDMRPPAVVFGLLVVYVVSMPILGFWVGSMLFLGALLYYSAIRSPPLLLVLSLGVPTLLFYVFGRVFLVRLPEAIVPVSRLLPQLPLVVGL
ncbi:tripartite tricarboxylate transporter TctB family protein [Halorubrum laminariae]|uniref:Tripartite tricarboxylate transporter TctB family protein n=1 Tax=Halorubrum laminariae TaxID=1433523 RepID=A0ABD6C0U4_9EURY|nr:tripartite tricarboxylate transporter TctB family protein [Halorubrum laminariae]